MTDTDTATSQDVASLITTKPDVHKGDEQDPRSRAAEQEFFDVINRNPPVKKDPKQGPVLEFYAGDDPASKTTVPLPELKTKQSENNDGLKFGFFSYTVFIVAFMCASSFFQDLLRLSTPIITSITGSGISERELNITINSAAIIILMLVVFVYIGIFGILAQKIYANFLNVDRVWQKSIAHFLQQTPAVKFQGIYWCMLTFRQFIKWRRITSFFFGIFWYVTFLFVVPSYVAGIILYRFEFIETVLLVGAFLWLLWVLRWFRKTVDLHTSYRDPTVQLCVMVAELHSRFVTRTFIGGGR